jgi:hypothetical protein
MSSVFFKPFYLVIGYRNGNDNASVVLEGQVYRSGVFPGLSFMHEISLT